MLFDLVCAFAVFVWLLEEGKQILAAQGSDHYVESGLHR